MKQQIYLYALLALAAVLMPASVYAQSTSSSSTIQALSLYNLQLSPNPIVAGSNETINFQLYDTYSSTIQNVNLELQGSYPILNYSPTNPYLISSIGQGLYGGVGDFFTYNIHIPKNTPSGNYTLDLVALYQTTEATTTVTGESVMPITFYVHGIPGMSINPSSSGVIPGNVSTINLAVMNSGYGTARNVTVNLLSTSNFSVSGTKTFFIGTLNTGASANLAASYIVGSRIQNGTYTIPVAVTYHSDQGTVYTQTLNATLSVRIQNPNLVATIAAANPQTLYSGYNQSLTVNIQNLGPGNAKNVTVNIQPSAGVNLLSSVHTFFIGSLGSGQSVNENILIAASNYSGPTASLVASLGYYSSNYQSHFSKNQTLGVSIAQSSIFQINAGNYSLTAGATSLPIRLKVTNTGNIDAQQIQFSFQSSYPVTPVASSFYVANLQPGQSTNVNFTVSVDSHATPGIYPITLYETWRQPNGASQQSYTGSNNYYATVSSTSGSSSGSLIGDVVVIAIIIVAAVVLIRRRMTKKEHKKTPKAL